MINLIGQLANILNDELAIYQEHYRLEADKADAIVARNTAVIESTSLEQETLLKTIAHYESHRKELIREYINRSGIEKSEDDISLKDIIAPLDEHISQQITVPGKELKSLLLKIQRLQETNTTLLNDNLEFYTMLMAGLRNSISDKTGYSREGAEESRITDSILVNRKI